MDAKGKEKGILKLEPRPRMIIDSRSELTLQGLYDRPPSSPQPSVDRLSVTWADPGNMTSPGVNLFHLPSDTPINNEVKFTTDMSEDEDYSASLSAVLRQRRASVRRSRKGRTRRPSSPFLPDETRPRRRSSVFTTSSGDTAISMEEQPSAVTQEQMFEKIHLHKQVLGSVKQLPLGMRRKLKVVHQAKTYIKCHEGQLQERLAQSKCTRDIYARFSILMATKWQQLKREAANTSNLLIPWELRIKEIESHFGSVVASYFTFLRWLFWVNLVIAFILLVFVIIPEYLTADHVQAGERKIILDEERRNATNLLTLWEFEGVLKCSAIFYGYYSNVEKPEYRMPLAYFLTGLAVYIYSFVAILRKMAENSRMSKLSEKEDECIFSWKLFTGWDFMIGNAETAHNRIASVILGFKEALLEEAEKKKNLRNWRVITLQAIANLCVIILLAVSAYAVVTVVSRSHDEMSPSWWRENETTVVVTVISITFPLLFEFLGFMEHYHPRKRLRMQLGRIMILNLLNLYSLIFALFSKIEGMSKELDSLQPNLNMNATFFPEATLNMNETLSQNLPLTCFETSIPCLPCDTDINNYPSSTVQTVVTSLLMVNNSINETNNDSTNNNKIKIPILSAENLVDKEFLSTTSSTVNSTSNNGFISFEEELKKIRNLSHLQDFEESEENSTELVNYEVEDDDDTVYGSITEKNFNIISEESPDHPSTDDYIDTTYNTSTDIQTESDTYMTLHVGTTDYVNESDFFSYNGSTNNIEDTTSTLWDTEITTKAYYPTSSTFVETSSIKETYSPNTYTEAHIFEPTVDFYPVQSTTTTTNVDSTSYLPLSTASTMTAIKICPDMFNYSMNCGDHNITQTFIMSKCTVIDIKCFVTKCTPSKIPTVNRIEKHANESMVDVFYVDDNNRKMYILTLETKKKLLKLCWETMFGQELVKLTVMDLVFVLLGTLFMDFFRALFVRYMNRCWCWDVEKKFPSYGDFKIAENILHLINNQGMVWMGMFFSPGLVVLNVFKLMIMMYLRSWAVITCNVPHEVVFRVSKSNNFYLGLLLTMLFLCVLPVGYTIVWVKPSWHCGPFSEYEKIYNILTKNIYKILPQKLNFILQYTASPAIVIPLLVLLILIIYYLTSLTNSLREANNDLKIQLRRERTEERRKMFQLADKRRRTESISMDNTPFARWKKALPSLAISKSIESDDHNKTTGDDTKNISKISKKRGGIFAKIVGLALDKKNDGDLVTDMSPSPNKVDNDTDTDFHESLPEELLKLKEITVIKNTDQKRKTDIEFQTIGTENAQFEKTYKTESEYQDYHLEKNKNREISKILQDKNRKSKQNIHEDGEDNDKDDKNINRQQTSQSSTQSKQSDSIGSVIPVITISTTESDEEILHGKKEEKETVHDKNDKNIVVKKLKTKNFSDPKLLRRQSSVDSITENDMPKQKKKDDGHKYQYSL